YLSSELLSIPTRRCSDLGDEVLVALVLVDPHVLVREHDILREGAVALHADRAGADAHLASAGAAVAAHAAHHVPLPRDAVGDAEDRKSTRLKSSHVKKSY